MTSFVTSQMQSFALRECAAANTGYCTRAGWLPVAIFVPILATYTTSGLTADDPEEPVTLPAEGTKEHFELIKAKHDAEKAAHEAAKAANEAAKAALASKYPADAVTKSAGILTQSGDALPIAEQLAMRAGHKLGQLIGTKAGTSAGNGKVLVTSKTDVAVLGAERVWFAQETARRTSSATEAANALTKILAAAADRAPPKDKTGVAISSTPVALSADALLKGAANLLGYFKADYEIKSATVTPQDEVVLSAITNQLVSKSIREGWSIPKSNSPIISSFNNLKAELQRGGAVAASLKLIEAKLTAIEKADSARLLAVLTDHAGFVTSSAQGGADGKPGVLLRAISGEQVFDPALTHILYAKFVHAGAMAVTRKHLFQLNPRLTFVGTATVAYTMTDATTGMTVFSGTGACTWPMGVVLSDVGKTPNQFNVATAEALSCRLD